MVIKVGDKLPNVTFKTMSAEGPKSLTTDEGYFSVEEVCALQSEGIRTVMGDPHASRRR